MPHRPDAAGTYQSRRTAVFDQVAKQGLMPAEAERWCAAWGIYAAGHQIDLRMPGFCTAGQVWIAELSKAAESDPSA